MPEGYVYDPARRTREREKMQGILSVATQQASRNFSRPREGELMLLDRLINVRAYDYYDDPYDDRHYDYEDDLDYAFEQVDRRRDRLYGGEFDDWDSMYEFDDFESYIEIPDDHVDVSFEEHFDHLTDAIGMRRSKSQLNDSPSYDRDWKCWKSRRKYKHRRLAFNP